MSRTLTIVVLTVLAVAALAVCVEAEGIDTSAHAGVQHGKSNVWRAGPGASPSTEPKGLKALGGWITQGLSSLKKKTMSYVAKHQSGQHTPAPRQQVSQSGWARRGPPVTSAGHVSNGGNQQNGNTAWVSAGTNNGQSNQVHVRSQSNIDTSTASAPSWINRAVTKVKSWNKAVTRHWRNANSNNNNNNNNKLNTETNRGQTHNAPDIPANGGESLNAFDKLGLHWSPVASLLRLLGARGKGREAFKNAEKGQTVRPTGAPASVGQTKTATVGATSTRLMAFLQLAGAATAATATPRGQCGPDVTQWLVRQMNANKDHPAIKTNRENSWAMWIPAFNIGWHAAFLNDFRNLVKGGGPWDYKATVNFQRGGCPNNCPRSVTLCGMCFSNDVPGNINYGWVGRAGRIRSWFLHNRASAAQAGGVDDPRDTVAINIGIQMWDGTPTLCDKVHRMRARMLTRDCDTCSTQF